MKWVVESAGKRDECEYLAIVPCSYLKVSDIQGTVKMVKMLGNEELPFIMGSDYSRT